MQLTPKTLLLFAFAVSLSSLVFALFTQYVLGLHPCELCIWQRYPYIAVALVALVGLSHPTTRTKTLWLCLAFFALEAGLAVYHVGVEQGMVESVAGCSASVAGGSLDDLKAQIMAAPMVSCNQPTAVFLGVSMAGWNALAAVLYTMIMLIGIRKARIHA